MAHLAVSLAYLSCLSRLPTSRAYPSAGVLACAKHELRASAIRHLPSAIQ